MLSNVTFTNNSEDMSSQLDGITSYPIVNGSFEFKTLKIYGQVGHQYYFIVYSQAIQNHDKIDLIYSNEKIDDFNLYFYFFPLQIRICDPGYAYIVTNNL